MKYGYIIHEDRDIFVHFSEIQMEGYKTLKRDDVVSFELEETPKGEKAVNVNKISRAVKKAVAVH